MIFLYRLFKINEIRDNLTEHLNGLKVDVLAVDTNSSKDFQAIILKRNISNKTTLIKIKCKTDTLDKISKILILFIKMKWLKYLFNIFI